MTVQIKKTSTDEANVSARQIRYDVYQGGEMIASFLDVVEAMDFADQLAEWHPRPHHGAPQSPPQNACGGLCLGMGYAAPLSRSTVCWRSAAVSVLLWFHDFTWRISTLLDATPLPVSRYWYRV